MSAMAPTRLRVVSPPGELSEREYAEASAELEGLLASLPGVVAVYSSGGRTAPGISDLDAIAVTERPPPRAIWDDLSPATRGVAMHTPFVVDRETFARHRWFAYLEPLELAGGEPIEVAEPPADDHLNALLAAEGLIVALAAFRKQLVTGRVKARSTLCALHATGYSLKLGGVTPERAPAAGALIERTEALRREWFERDAAEAERELAALVVDSGDALVEAMGALPAVEPAAGKEDLEEIRLRGPWSNVVLASGRGPGEANRPGPAARLLGHSRRAGELVWRSRPRRLAVPGRALDWLAPPADRAAAEAWAERREIAARYEAFARECGPGWSTIGFIGIFRP